MGTLEWETVTITLPSASVAPLKKLLREETLVLWEAVRTEAIRVHKEVLKTRSVKLYRERLLAYNRSRWDREEESTPSYGGFGRGGYGYSSYNYEREAKRREEEARKEVVNDLVQDVLNHILWEAEGKKDWHTKEIIPGAPIHQPTVADIERVLRKPNSKTTHFSLFNGEGGISFDGNVVTYSVGENKNSREYGNNDRLTQVLFGYLDKVKWTRGTGYVGVGNDEYSRDSRESGGGGNYITRTGGPLGEAEQKRRHDIVVLQAGYDPRTGKRF